MHATPDSYLSALRESLADLDPALAAEALQAARGDLEAFLEQLSWQSPGLALEETMARAEAVLGSPEAFAAKFPMEKGWPLGGSLRPRPKDRRPPEWPGFFEILAEPRAYTSLVLLGLIFPLGIFAFTWVSTGLSLALGLLVIVLGFPLLVLVLGSFRALGLAHGRLVEALTGLPMPRRLVLLPRTPGFWKKLAALFTEGLTWRSLALLVLLLPLGITYFVFLVTGLALALSTLLLPLAHFSGAFGCELSGSEPPLWASGGLSFLGALMLVAMLHAGLALGRFHATLSRRVLLGE